MAITLSKEEAVAAQRKAMQRCKRLDKDGKPRIVHTNINTLKALGLTPEGGEWPKNPGTKIEYDPIQDLNVEKPWPEDEFTHEKLCKIRTDRICDAVGIDIKTGALKTNSALPRSSGGSTGTGGASSGG